MSRQSRTLDVEGPRGRIEALLYVPEREPPRFAAIVCHPHPLFGGTMHNHATVRLARGLADRGEGVALRFNFRGVGRSAGVHDEGRGEVDDARAVLGRLRADWPHVPLWSTGFSFGARVALAAAAAPESSVERVLVLGLAVQTNDHAFARDLAIPMAVVQAENDEYGPPREVEALLAGSAAPRRLFAVAGTTHLFTEDLPALERAIDRAIDWLTMPARSG